MYGFIAPPGKKIYLENSRNGRSMIERYRRKKGGVKNGSGKGENS
jgi:hypothetical protein